MANMIPQRAPAESPVIVSCCRTAIGRSDDRRGLFRFVPGDDLAAAAVASAVQRGAVDPRSIGELVVGLARQRGELAANAARRIAILAGLPFTVAATTVDRGCGSGLEAFLHASRAIVAGDDGVRIVAGVEHMGRHGLDADADIHPRTFVRSSRGVSSRGLCADLLAASRGISRRRQEEYALESHRRAARAAGMVAADIVAVPGHDEAGGLVDVVADQPPVNEVSLEAFAELEPVFLPGRGTVTAATTAPPGDGAAAAVLMSAAEATRQGIAVLARVVDGTAVGVSPAESGTGPIHAIGKLLRRVGIGIESVGVVELDEAFAAETLCCIDDVGLDPSRVNLCGGALAVGQPLGASGLRMVSALLHAMRVRDARLGMVAMGIGLGQGIALLLERAES